MKVPVPVVRVAKADSLATAAHIVALRWIIANYVPPRLQQLARDDAMAVAIGVLGGCCGPNGDFSSRYSPPDPEAL
jgi:hypothetical protein